MPTALITGASTGIGRATALHFAREGYRVFAGARNPDTVEHNERIVPKRLDVDQDESVRACVAEILTEAGTIDVLVNNAGIGFGCAVELAPLDRIRAMFETNFFGAVRMMQAVLPSMRERRAGAIVNVASIMARVTMGCHGFYAATKFALAAVSESLAMEVRPFNIHVAIIEPGVILTPIWAKSKPMMPPDHPYQLPARRLRRMVTSQMVGGAPPAIVAQAIFDAVQEGAAKLHYPVGLDAEALTAARDRITAAEWVDLMAEPDENLFLQRAAAVFQADLYNPPSLHQRSAHTAPPDPESPPPSV